MRMAVARAFKASMKTFSAYLDPGRPLDSQNGYRTGAGELSEGRFRAKRADVVRVDQLAPLRRERRPVIQGFLPIAGTVADFASSGAWSVECAGSPATCTCSGQFPGGNRPKSLPTSFSPYRSKLAGSSKAACREADGVTCHSCFAAGPPTSVASRSRRTPRRWASPRPPGRCLGGVETGGPPQDWRRSVRERSRWPSWQGDAASLRDMGLTSRRCARVGIETLPTGGLDGFWPQRGVWDGLASTSAGCSI